MTNSIPVPGGSFDGSMLPTDGGARRLWRGLALLACLSLATAAHGQVPLDQVPPAYLAPVQAVIKGADFTFETSTKPVRVRIETMEKLFDNPCLAAAMWRHCQFVPTLFAFEQPGKNLVVDDSRGLRGTLYLVHQQPGARVYYIEGRVEKGRMKNPFAVGAKMVVVYRYWQNAEGFQSHLNTWTALDSGLLSAVTRPFRKYIRFRQEEFIAYIMANIAQGGEFAQIRPAEFLDPIKREGDRIAIREFTEVFGH